MTSATLLVMTRVIRSRLGSDAASEAGLGHVVFAWWHFRASSGSGPMDADPRVPSVMAPGGGAAACASNVVLAAGAGGAVVDGLAAGVVYDGVSWAGRQLGSRLSSFFGG